MSKPAAKSPSPTATQSEITGFFDEMSVERNEKIRSNPIVDYEQHVRAETVLGMLSPGRGEKILDIGCGNARDMVRILEAGARVVGIDISEGMVAAAGRELEQSGHANFVLRVGDATKLEFQDHEFDKILCSEVIEHIPAAQKALKEMRRVLKPGGSIVLSTPNPCSWYGFDRYVVWERLLRRPWSHPYDHWRSMDDLTTMVRNEGFELVAKTGACYVPGFLVTYFLLPRFVQKLLLRLVALVEPVAAKALPRHGYMVCVMAMRSAS